VNRFNRLLPPLRDLFYRTMIFCGLTLFAGPMASSFLIAVEIPAVNAPINDLAHMMPKPSSDDLEDRLRRYKTRTGRTIVILTVSSVEGEGIENFGRKAFNSLPLAEKEFRQTVFLVVARKEQKVSVQTGSELQSLFPQPRATEKIQAQVEPYFNGMRPDLGIHAGVHYIFGVINGEFRIDRTTEAEELENASKRGGGAGAIFALCLAPFLAFFGGMLWGIYATHYGVQRETRLFIGAVLGGGIAKIVAMLMTIIGGYSDALWYFIFFLSISLAVFASLTEYWMAGEWSGIPRIKEKARRKPEDNMGI
jgi:uncharacterized membrane protein YgcG